MAASAKSTRFIEIEEDPPCYMRYITVIVRTWGILTAGAMMGLAIRHLKEEHTEYTGWYLLPELLPVFKGNRSFPMLTPIYTSNLGTMVLLRCPRNDPNTCGLAIVVTFFELTWLINKCACCDDNGCCCMCWRGIMWIDNWKRSILYVALSVPCFLRGLRVLLGVICGLLLIVLALMYFIKSFKNVHCGRKTKRNVSYMEVTSPSVSLVQHEISQPDPGTVPSPPSSQPSSPAKDQDSDTSYQGGQPPQTPGSPP